MKQIGTITLAVAIAAILLLATVTPSLAENGAAPERGCQPGADNDIIGSWQLLSLEEYAQFLVDEFNAPSYELALERATITYSFCDHNGDNYACVMEQNLPTDANGSSHWVLIEDNHPFGGK